MDKSNEVLPTKATIRTNIIKWIEALRSGKYAQGKGRLRRDDFDGSFYCCLGVACDLSDNSLWKNTKYDNLTFAPASVVCDSLGMDSEIEHKLIDMNDGRGKSFSEIADYIEETLLPRYPVDKNSENLQAVG